MNDIQLFFKDGFIAKKVAVTDTMSRFHNLLAELRAGNLKQGFRFVSKEKYPRGRDLRPYPFTYDDVFLDFLFDQNIPHILKNLTGLDLHLAHVRLRINAPGEPYTSWHRDTNFYHGHVSGNAPPLINIHYYPTLGQPSEPTIRLWKGTHLLMQQSYLLDRMTTLLNRGTDIFTDNNSFVIMDTSILHQVLPATQPDGALRVLYSFCRPFQLSAFKEPEMQKMHKLYSERAQTYA